MRTGTFCGVECLSARGEAEGTSTLTITTLSFGVSESRPVPTLERINGLAPARHFDLDIYLRSSFPTLEAFEEGVVGLSPPLATGLSKFYP